MSFAVGADAYDLFMGRYSVPLGPVFAAFSGVDRGQRVLDVGCGPGALTAELERRLDPGAVAAVDPSISFVDAARARHPLVDVRRATAAELPFDADTFDATLAQLVIQFLPDAVAGLAEMARVTRSGGVVAATVWDHERGGGPLSLFWDAARELDPTVADEAEKPGVRKGHLAELFEAAGLQEVESGHLEIAVEHATFEAWWDPFTLGVGTAGGYLETLPADATVRLREQCRSMLPDAPFTVTARAWAARGRA